MRGKLDICKELNTDSMMLNPGAPLLQFAELMWCKRFPSLMIQVRTR